MAMYPSGSWRGDPGVLDAFGSAVLLVDASGLVEYANSAARRAFETPGAPLAGADLGLRLLGPADRSALVDAMATARSGVPWRGRLTVVESGSPRETEVGCWPLGAGEAMGLLVTVKGDGDDSAGLHEARRLADRLARLARVTSDLVMADTVEAVVKIVVAHTAEVVGATIASLTLRDDEDTVCLLGLKGGREGDAQQWERYPIWTRTPASDVIRTGQRLMLVGAGAIAERYPDLPGADRGDRTLLCIPLQVSTRTIGAIGLSFPSLRAMDAAELEFYDVLADICAQALDRISAQEQAAAQTAKLTFLADASAELASSLDYEATLANVARLAVPRFADWCAIDLVEDGQLHRLAVEHTDPAKVQLARDLEERYPADREASSGPWHVMRSGRSEWVREVTDEMLVAAAVDEEHLRIARDLRLRSALTVPLVARGRVLGVITWVSAESERLYGRDDLLFAEELAKRAGIAIDNAELHSQTLEAAVRLQQAVLPDAMPVVHGWELASYYSPSGRTDVGGDFFDAIPLADGRLGLVVGDVMGRGVSAAAAMAQVRAAVRAFVAVDPAPATVLDKLDLMFAQYPTDQLVTMVYLLVDPAEDSLTMANAGHPAPVILHADATTAQLPGASGTPLGTVPLPRTQLVCSLRSGDTLLAYTDGMVERRNEDFDGGQARLRAHLPLLASGDLSTALERLAGTVRDPERDDDVAALAARRR